MRDLLDIRTSELIQAVADKYVTARRHPTEPLTIYNYTARAQVEGMWNAVTRVCRGLIVDDDGGVVARPYPKFFGYGEPHAEVPETFRVLDKLDGSLGITYRGRDGRVRIATRGSFESEQAKHATALWEKRYADVDVPERCTLLFEIVYPTNRIVLDYGDLDDLVLHGCIDNLSGADIPLDRVAWPGPRVQVFDPQPLPVLLSVARDLKADLSEGFVLVEHPAPVDRPARRLKVKCDDYVRIHRVVSGATPRNIWALGARGDASVFSELLDHLPPAHYERAHAIWRNLGNRARGLELEAREAFAGVIVHCGIDADRKTKALRIQEVVAPELRKLVFAILSNKDPYPLAWKLVEPSGAADDRDDERAL